MALTARLNQTRPDTLPEDFNEWDGVDVPVTLPEDFTEFDASPHDPAAEQAPKEPDQEQPLADVSLDPRPQTAQSIPIVSSTDSRVTDLASETKRQTSAETETEQKGKSKIRFAVIGVVSALVLLALIFFIYFRLVATAGNSKQSIRVQPPTESASQAGMREAQPGSLIKPSPSVPAGPSPSTPVDLAAQAKSQPQGDPVQPDSMDTQLNAPARLPRNLHATSDLGTPAPGTAVIEDIGANGAEAVNGIFGTKKTPQVKVDAKLRAISAGVAEGRLIRKATPVYPQIARSARVSGTVVLNAVISKDGIPQGIRAVSGPAMLRQAAADAVKNWRYKPYLLNNEPVEVETTINVVFTIN